MPVNSSTPLISFGSVKNTRGFGTTPPTVTVDSPPGPSSPKAAAAARPTGRFTITPTFDDSITNDPDAATIRATIDQAIANFEAVIATPVQVAIRFRKVPTGLGESNTWISGVSYTSFRAK